MMTPIKKEYEKLFILLPYCQILGGKSLDFILKVEFESTSDDIDLEYGLNVLNITGTRCIDGESFNFDFLNDFSNYLVYTTFIKLIVYNKHCWNKEEIWW